MKIKCPALQENQFNLAKLKLLVESSFTLVVATLL